MNNQSSSTIFHTFLSGSWNHYLLYSIIGLFGLYSFFIASTVININERKDTRTDIRDLQSMVSELEINYFAVASTITMEKAISLGFNESINTRFAYTTINANTVALAQ